MSAWETRKLLEEARNATGEARVEMYERVIADLLGMCVHFEEQIESLWHWMDPRD